MENKSIQIQSVIYGNEKSSLKKAMDAIANAVRVTKANNGIIKRFVLYYGDATKEPIYSADEVNQIKEQYSEFFEFKYKIYGYNAGSANGQTVLGMESDTDFLLLMNPDVIVSPRYFIDVIGPFENEKVGMTEGRQCPIEHHKEYNIKTGEEDWCTGACSVIRTELFKELGGYDYKTFFLYCDDVDLSWRVRDKGYKIIYVPNAMVFHAKRLTNNGGWMPTNAEVYYSAEAALLMAYKWSNDKRVNELINRFKNGSETEKRVLEAFNEKKEKGELPKQIVSKVATFNGDYYSENRFVI